MKRNELMHYGVLGMKWGVRRYQNSDGALTDAGRRRIRNVRDDDPYRVSRIRSRAHEETSKDYGNVSSALGSGKTATSSVKNIVEQSGRRKREKTISKMDLSSMSDDELRNTINRLNLERNYKNLTTENIEAGSRYIGSLLSTVGDIAAVGASVASILMAVHQLRR